MKNLKKNTMEDFAIFQEILETYRYPDGTLNKIAVFISAVALILLVTFSHLTIEAVKNIKSANTAEASELNADQTAGVNENDLTASRQQAKEYADKIKELLEQEMLTNSNIDTTYYNELKKQLENLSNYSSNQLSSNSSQFNTTINGLRQTYDNALESGNLKMDDLEKLLAELQSLTNENNTTLNNNINSSIAKQSEEFEAETTDLQEQIDKINDRISDNSTYFDFGYDDATGAYGYYINDEFKPW